jgi:hypothetical protein
MYGLFSFFDTNLSINNLLVHPFNSFGNALPAHILETEKINVDAAAGLVTALNDKYLRINPLFWGHLSMRGLSKTHQTGGINNYYPIFLFNSKSFTTNPPHQALIFRL